jgi:hypothetical protein
VTAPLSESQVIQACKTLFGAEVSVGKGFLCYLRPEGLKSAYRKKAKETHPDLFASETPRILKEQASLFRDVVDAYDVVTLFFKQREEGLWTPASFAHPAGRRHQDQTQTKKPEYRTHENANPGQSGQKPLPLRRMQIGRFLYYRGFITYRALIDAVVWQRKQRPVIGDIALRWGWLSADAVERIMKTGGFQGRFGEKAVNLDLLSSFQVKVLLYFQHSQQERLGSYFVRHNILETEELDRLVQELREHNARIHEDLIRAGQARSAYA